MLNANQNEINTNHNGQTPVFDWALNFINKIDFSHSHNILDIGCRNGLISGYLAERFNQLNFVAIENCADDIELAKDNYAYSNLNFENECPESFHSTNQYDTVISFSCLHWINNQLKVLKNAYEALKPGGKAYLQFFASHGRPKNDRFLYKTAYSPQWKSYFNNFKPDYSEVALSEFSAQLHAVGFVIHRIEFQRYESSFEHPEHLHQWLSTWATHKNRIPKRKQDQFLSDTVNTYLNAHRYALNDKFPYYEYVLEVTCAKPDTANEIQNSISRSYNNVVFTPREIFVLRHYLCGKSSKEIGSIASVSAKAIEFHIANIKNKLDCHKRSDIYRAALDYGFINLMFIDT